MTKIKRGVSNVFGQIPGFLVGAGLVTGIVFALWLAPRVEALKVAAENYQVVSQLKIERDFQVK